MRNVYKQIKTSVSLVPLVRTASEDGVVTDTLSYLSLKLTALVGALDLTSGNETYVVKVQHGDAANLSDAADLAGATATVTAANQVKQIDCDVAGRKRYVRAVLTAGGTTPSIALSAAFELGRAQTEPVN